MSAAKHATVESFLASLSPSDRGLADRLQTLALGARDGVTEHIKWNAPSYCVDGDDRITLGIDPKGGLRAVLHRGVKVKDTAGFAFDDRERLAAWPAKDRGVISFKDEAALIAREGAVASLFKRWLVATV